MEQRIKKPTLSLRNNLPASNTSPTSNVEPNPPQEYPEYTQEILPALEWIDIDEDYKYYSERKKPRNSKHTQRAEANKKEARWQ